MLLASVKLPSGYSGPDVVDTVRYQDIKTPTGLLRVPESP